MDERNQKQVAVDMQVNSQLSLDLNDFKEVIVRTALGSEFQSLGGATERVQEPNNVRVSCRAKQEVSIGGVQLVVGSA